MTLQRVLIVDDHALVRDGVRLLLAGHADVVGEAGDAAQARAQVAALAPDIVLLDIGMKGGDGLALAAEIAQRPSAPALVMLSMYDGPEYLRRAREAGARGYVRKDAPSGEILAALAAVAAGGSHWPAPEDATAPTQRRTQLTDRERDILRGLARGASSKQLAAALATSVRTIDTHRQNIRRKLRIEGQAELIRYAVEHFGGP
jgi:DNA-binding NarL/FixJ family response regulator